jgi:hypothetical protein
MTDTTTKISGREPERVASLKRTPRISSEGIERVPLPHKRRHHGGSQEREEREKWSVIHLDTLPDSAFGCPFADPRDSLRGKSHPLTQSSVLLAFIEFLFLDQMCQYE